VNLPGSGLVRGAAFGLTALLALCGAAPPQAPRYPQASLTDLGSAKLVGESDAGATISGVQVFLAAGLDREPAAGNGVAGLVAECVLRTPVTAATGERLPLRDAIQARGGSVTYTVDGRSTHYYLEGRPGNVASLVALFGRALAAPDFSPPTVRAARAALTARIDELESSPLSSAIEMFKRSYYATGVGRPALGTAASVANVSSRDMTDFFQHAYRRAGLSASAVGGLSPELGRAIKALASVLPEGPVEPVVERAKPIPANAPRVVAHRDIGAPWVVVGFAAPSPASRDFGAMLVLESMLSEAFERSSATTLGLVEKSVGAFYLYDSTPASLIVYVNGTEVDPTLALRELLVVSRSLAQRPLTAATLSRFKTTAEGQFLTDSVSLSDRSYLLGAFASWGLGADAMNAALDALEQTTPADVQRVAKQYLQRYIVTLVLPRQVSPGD
jgi:zinc protease